MANFLVAASEKLAKVYTADHAIKTQPFLETCRLILPIIDQLGAAFKIVKGDISGNIERLQQRYDTDPAKFEQLFEIVKDEVARVDHEHGGSCTKGLLWLKRAMEFVVSILAKLQAEPTTAMGTIVSDTYYATLYKFHGFLVSTTFTVAFKFVPSRESFLAHLGGDGGPALMADMATFSGDFAKLLAEVHSFIASNGLDDPYKV